MGMEKLKKAALVVIANSLTKSEIGQLETTFKELDTNHDGFLTLSELDDAITQRKFFFYIDYFLYFTIFLFLLIINLLLD